MPDIVHDFPIKASASCVFQAISTPVGLNQLWTAQCSGEPRLGAEYDLCFGPEYQWRGRVSRYRSDAEFELELTRSDDEWMGTRVGFQLQDNGEATQVRFHHVGWPEPSEHYRVSCYCWAMYLRVLKRHLEHGEFVPYEHALRCENALLSCAQCEVQAEGSEPLTQRGSTPPSLPKDSRVPGCTPPDRRCSVVRTLRLAGNRL